MFDVLTEQEVTKVKPYIRKGNCLNITINYSWIEIIKVIQAFCSNYSKIMSNYLKSTFRYWNNVYEMGNWKPVYITKMKKLKK